MSPVKLSFTDNAASTTYTLHYGRNAAENWELYDSAEADDLWFHLDDCPSAHVYLQVSKEDPSEAALQYAARLVLQRTPKVNQGNPKIKKVNVIYCSRSNLKKGKSAGEILILQPKQLSSISVEVPLSTS